MSDSTPLNHVKALNQGKPTLFNAPLETVETGCVYGITFIILVPKLTTLAVTKDPSSLTNLAIT